MSTLEALGEIGADYVHTAKVARPEARLTLGETTLKWYDIAPEDKPVPLAVRALARRNLRDAAKAGELGLTASLGFVILHRCGESFYFLIATTWRNDNELWQTVWAKVGDASYAFRPWVTEGRTGRRSASGSSARSVTSAMRGASFSARSARKRTRTRTCAPRTRAPCRSAWRSLRGLTRPGWLAASELRIGLGCMRLSTDESRDEELALETIAAAAAAGITVFDTARAYGRGPEELGHNEALLARALRRADAEATARIVTKGGMTRPGGGWITDGRAKAIRADCEASLAALDGLAIDLYLVHAPDPRTPWRTTVRALARLVDDGLMPRVGLSNVNRSSWTRRSSSRRSPPSRSRSAPSTTALSAAGSSSGARSRGSP